MWLFLVSHLLTYLRTYLLTRVRHDLCFFGRRTTDHVSQHRHPFVAIIVSWRKSLRGRRAHDVIGYLQRQALRMATASDDDDDVRNHFRYHLARRRDQERRDDIASGIDRRKGVYDKVLRFVRVARYWRFIAKELWSELCANGMVRLVRDEMKLMYRA